MTKKEMIAEAVESLGYMPVVDDDGETVGVAGVLWPVGGLLVRSVVAG